ncbi:hypothetical protein [Candidatus Poriferisodalis sp.]|uniref:hypothetical protein n=1 Tax=Candidatus Poriferisodalis sp. TaxID=3101277 RepID=UPI003B52DB08
MESDDSGDAIEADASGDALTFVDLYQRSRRLEAWSTTLSERLTARIQDRLHLVSSADYLLIRWPWIAYDDVERHREAISGWLDRLDGVDADEPVIARTVKSIGVLLHRIGDDPILVWARQDSEQLETVCNSARALELSALLERRNAIWAPERYHYRLPSGEHTDLFIRAADALHSPQDVSALVCWLTPYLSGGVGVIVDTAGLTPLLLQIDSLMAKFSLELGPTSVVPEYPVGRPLVRRAVEAALRGPTDRLLALLSVSSTGALRRLLCDELERAIQSLNISRCALDVLVDRTLAPDQSGESKTDGDVEVTTWLGLGRPESGGPLPTCQLCRSPEKSQIVAIDPRNYGAMTLPTAQLVMPDTGYAQNAHGFWELVNQTRGIAIEANPHPASRVARGKRTPLPVRPIFELIASADDLAAAVGAQREQLSRAGPEALPRCRDIGLVVAADNDIADTPLPEFAGGGSVNLSERLRVVVSALGVDESVPIVGISRGSDPRGDDEQLTEALERLPTDKSALVFSWGTVTGLTLRNLKTTIAEKLRTLKRPNRVDALVLHSRPSSPREWTALQNQFRPGGLWCLWTSCLTWLSPLQDERRLLDRSGIETGSLSDTARRFLSDRQEFLSLHDTHQAANDDWSPRLSLEGDGPDPTHVFWGMSRSDEHQSHVRGRSLYGAELDCLTAYGAIGAVVNHSRLASRSAVAPRWVMFDLGRIVRSYFDAIIVCALLRWMHPGELWWEGDANEPESARDSVAFLIDQAQGEPSEQVLLLPELLLATALGKVPSTARDLVCERAGAALEEWRRNNEFDAARGAIEVGLKLLTRA